MSNISLKRTAVIAAVFAVTSTSAVAIPCLAVPACPETGHVEYTKSVPDLTPFPTTTVDLCYTDTSIKLVFTAHDEEYFYFDPSQTTNGDIWEFEVMEAFLYRGTNDPQTYLEFEINPGNVTYQAFVYNPSKVRAAGAAFDHFFVSDPAADGFSAETELDPAGRLWTSRVIVPLGIFNVDNGKARGTEWRMNFFRTVTNETLYPDQLLGAWSPPNQASFHMTPYFGRVTFT